MDVLLVEDDDTIAEPLAKGLQRAGFTVRRAATGAAALAAAEPQVILLDLGLPDLDGYEVCRRLRARSDVPIIVVTARSEEVDRVIGLELGADDYVVKPFGFRELVARIRAVTRRRQPQVGPTIRLGPLQVDRRARRVSLHGAEVALTAKEFDLLAFLAEDPGAVRGRQEILEEVWDAHGTGRPRPWTSTLPRCAASSATRDGSRRSAGSASGCAHHDQTAACQLPVADPAHADRPGRPARAHDRPLGTPPPDRSGPPRRGRAGPHCRGGTGAAPHRRPGPGDGRLPAPDRRSSHDRRRPRHAGRRL